MGTDWSRVSSSLKVVDIDTDTMREYVETRYITLQTRPSVEKKWSKYIELRS